MDKSPRNACDSMCDVHMKARNTVKEQSKQSKRKKNVQKPCKRTVITVLLIDFTNPALTYCAQILQEILVIAFANCHMKTRNTIKEQSKQSKR